MQRFHVHVTTRGGVAPEVARLVLYANANNFWCAADGGVLASFTKGELVVCAGRECAVAGCTRAQTFRESEAGYGATPASDALDLLPTPLTEGENRAITEYHRGLETEISNFAYFVERTFAEPLTINAPADVLGVARGYLLELKSRRAEQGALRGHGADHPMNRIRYWMERTYPDEREAAKQFSEWVITKLEAGRLAESTYQQAVHALHHHGMVPAVTNTDRFVYKRTGKVLDPALIELDLDERGQPGTKHFVCKHHSGFANETPECKVCHGVAEPVWYRYSGSGVFAPQFMTRDEVEHTSTPVLSEGQLPEGAQPVSYDLQTQIDRLATYILEEVPGEPSQNEGAIDTAIRIMRDLQEQIATRKKVQHDQLQPVIVAVDRLFGEDAKEVLAGSGWQGLEIVIPAILEKVAAKYQKQNELIEQTLTLLAGGDEEEQKLARELRDALGKAGAR